MFADTSMEVVPEIPLRIYSDADIQFEKKRACLKELYGCGSPVNIKRLRSLTEEDAPSWFPLSMYNDSADAYHLTTLPTPEFFKK